MTGQSKQELINAIRERYQKSSPEGKAVMLTEVCAATGYHRKYAISVLNRPAAKTVRGARKRQPTYSASAVKILALIWEAAGYPWSVRLRAILPLWMPWARQRVKRLTQDIEEQLLRMSPRQIDRRLQSYKRKLGRRMYGRTKPGSLLKHHIAVKTDCWDVSEAGYTEIDLVSHSGPAASGEFGYSLNVTDIHTTWVETRAVMGRGEQGVVGALEQIRSTLPFPLRAIDSDNGSEFINYHLYDYCQERTITFTRGRPYKKNDNAHIEQKNWTHVRKLMGWERYDTPEAVAAMNDLYANELRLMMNFFQPTVKLVRKERIGSKLRRVYDAPTTPLDRLVAQHKTTPPEVQALLRQRESLDPFELSAAIERKLERIHALRTK